MNLIQQKDLVIEALRTQNTQLKMELASVQRDIPTPDMVRKAYYFQQLLDFAKSYPQKEKINFKKVD